MIEHEGEEESGEMFSPVNLESTCHAMTWQVSLSKVGGMPSPQQSLLLQNHCIPTKSNDGGSAQKTVPTSLLMEWRYGTACAEE